MSVHLVGIEWINALVPYGFGVGRPGYFNFIGQSKSYFCDFPPKHLNYAVYSLVDPPKEAHRFFQTWFNSPAVITLIL